MVQNTNSPPPFDHLQGPPNIICGLSFPYGSGVGAEVSIPRSWAHLENFLRGVIREEVEAKVEAHFFRVKEGKEGSGDGGGSGGTNENLRLRFRSKIPSIVYTANNIEAKNGEELGVELFDVVNDRIIDWLGNRLSDRQWKTMVKQALQYVPITIPTFDPPNLQENLELQNEAMDQNASVFNQNNIGASNGNYEFQNQTLLGNFHDFSFNHLTSEDHYNYTIQTLLSPGEASTSNAQNINNYDENTSTCNPYFQGTWNKLVLKPK
uniref:Uncharacterized protein n=1 Tax=Cucumis sativus TaxID=3659 RepID=A0A0A0LYD9_CUCSA